MQFAHSSAQSLVHQYIGEYRITNEVRGAKVQGRSGMECAECAMRRMSQPLTAKMGLTVENQTVQSLLNNYR